MKWPGSKEVSKDLLWVWEHLCVSMSKSPWGLAMGPGNSWPPLCVCTCVSEMVCTSEWSRAGASGTRKFRCQQLRRLESRDSYWVSEPSCCRDQHCTYVYLFPLTNLCPAQPERAAGWGRWCCLYSCECSMCLSVICVASCAYMYGIYMFSGRMCLLGTHFPPCYRLDVRARSSSSPLSGCQIQHEIFSSNDCDLFSEWYVV